MTKISIVIVDDHAIVRRGLRDLFATTDDLELVGEAADGDEAVSLVRELHPTVVLMDLSMPNVDGVEATKLLRAIDPTVQIVVLTSFGDQVNITRALDAGAVGYLLKHAEPDDILSGIRVAAAGGAPLDPAAARVLLQLRTGPRPPSSDDLTEREREVLLCVRRGLANKQIARELGITERTVKAHLTSVFASLNVSDRTQAALWAASHLS